MLAHSCSKADTSAAIKLWDIDILSLIAPHLFTSRKYSLPTESHPLSDSFVCTMLARGIEQMMRRTIAFFECIIRDGAAAPSPTTGARYERSERRNARDIKR